MNYGTLDYMNIYSNPERITTDTVVTDATVRVGDEATVGGVDGVVVNGR